MEFELGHGVDALVHEGMARVVRIAVAASTGADSVEVYSATSPTSYFDVEDLLEVRLDLGAGDGRADRVAVAGSRDDDQTSVLAFGGGRARPAFVQIDGASRPTG